MATCRHLSPNKAEVHYYTDCAIEKVLDHALNDQSPWLNFKNSLDPLEENAAALLVALGYAYTEYVEGSDDTCCARHRPLSGGLLASKHVEDIRLWCWGALVGDGGGRQRSHLWDEVSS